MCPKAKGHVLGTERNDGLRDYMYMYAPVDHEKIDGPPRINLSKHHRFQLDRISSLKSLKTSLCVKKTANEFYITNRLLEAGEFLYEGGASKNV